MKDCDAVAAGTLVTDNFACFEWKLEKTLEEELGVKEFEGALSEAMKEFSVDRKDDAIKAPAIMRQTLAKLAEQKITSNSLEAILEKIQALKSKSLADTQTDS